MFDLASHFDAMPASLLLLTDNAITISIPVVVVLGVNTSYVLAVVAVSLGFGTRRKSWIWCSNRLRT